MIGKVVRVIAGFYDVKSNEDQQHYRIRGSGNLRYTNNAPVVGDYVEFSPNGLLTKILERKNFFIRPKIANIDQAIIVMSLKEPKFSSLLLDKFLMIVESKNIEPIIFFTKTDLDEFFDISIYQKMGYKCYAINNNKFDKKPFLDLFKNKTSVFMGQTGVGKTSTINNLSDSNFAIQQISKALGRGKHTTRVVQIIDWNEGELIDTPGFSSIQIDLEPLEMARSFINFKEAAKECKFKSCIHFNEPEHDCKIKTLVRINEIPQWRYQNYLDLLKEVI
ncbi:ribosome small subunit-dependent GTPase A [Mycoplasma iguanae]|uniref:Small ribosomal subunit biogenesis GTPase RsgA n=1 Tax=Mycoplasma iguanae TaxID=292461 RepID=A0ABY5RBN9_9MOLU|nr:ribosome small subunit-dependent GTPase A [Mycoplasma iguanae]UVD81762.1 ribosome small subunit-dependent GTPase A [Mycoplasma iguanae]